MDIIPRIHHQRGRTRQRPEFKLREELINRNRGKHIWKCGLLEMSELQPYRCMKCNLTMAELQELGNTGVCSSEIDFTSTVIAEDGRLLLDLGTSIVIRDWIG